MTPYFVVLILSLLCISAYQKKKRAIYIVLCALPMILLIGFRSNMVGTDTAGYCRMFLSMKDYLNLENPWQYFSTEKGFIALNLILIQIAEKYWVFLTAVGAIGICCTLRSISKLSEAWALSLFIYITLGYYLFGFAAIRQYIAMSIYMLALPYLLNSNLKKYAIVVCIAALFHQTVLIALPLYFFVRLPFNKKTLSLVVIGGILVGALIPHIMAFAATVEDRYAVYTEYSGGGSMFTIFYTIIAIFFIFQRTKMQEEYLKRYDLFLNMIIFGSLIYIVVTFSGLYGEVTRFAAYFQLATVFIWADLYKYRKSKLSPVFWGIVVAVHLVYFYVYLDKIGHITPFVLNSALD